MGGLFGGMGMKVFGARLAGMMGTGMAREMLQAASLLAARSPDHGRGRKSLYTVHKKLQNAPFRPRVPGRIYGAIGHPHYRENERRRIQRAQRAENIAARAEAARRHTTNWRRFRVRVSLTVLPVR